MVKSSKVPLSEQIMLLLPTCSSLHPFWVMLITKVLFKIALINFLSLFTILADFIKIPCILIFLTWHFLSLIYRLFSLFTFILKGRKHSAWSTSPSVHYFYYVGIITKIYTLNLTKKKKKLCDWLAKIFLIDICDSWNSAVLNSKWFKEITASKFSFIINITTLV